MEGDWETEPCGRPCRQMPFSFTQKHRILQKLYSIKGFFEKTLFPGGETTGWGGYSMTRRRTNNDPFTASAEGMMTGVADSLVSTAKAGSLQVTRSLESRTW